ncbi:MAG: PilZ domain-containing protein [Deltaproteobacteria bacterium]|nr:PilZ domain-containing protein [Deltaproteobacteria bacterium]
MPRQEKHGKRVSDRVEVDISALYESPTLYSLAQIRNISVGGAFVRSDVLDEPGTEHILQFAIPNQPHPLNLVGRVVWTRVEPPWHAGMGLEFIAMEDTDHRALSEFVTMVRGAHPLAAPDPGIPRILRN